MSLKLFYIKFDRSDAIYMTDKIISKGEANVFWIEEIHSRDSNGDTKIYSTTYEGNEQYFTLTITLLEQTEDDGNIHLPIGLSKYPFCIELPHDISCSFEHRNGHIRYTIKVIMKRPWRFNYECKAAFTIITNYDLNIRREQCMTVYDKVTKNISFLFSKDGSITLHVILPTTGFVPGQWIEAILNLNNTSSAYSLEFHASSKKMTVMETVAATQNIGPFKKDDIIIRYVYIFRKIIRQYPVLIGTISLQYQRQL
ncbi:hypothetical protein P5V15_008008 [Pogonomyrmex californicus]